MPRPRPKLAQINARTFRVLCYECKQCGVHLEAVNGRKPMRCIDSGCGSYEIFSFDSRGERDRWAQLKTLQKTSHITRLRRQVRLALKVNGIKVTTYIADFDYYDADGKYVIEDFKGAITDLFELKAKMVAAQYGVPIRITSSR